MADEIVRPFDSFIPVYRMLVWAGYYKLLKDPRSRLKRICHKAYQPLAFLVALMFNVQHIIFIVQRRYNMDLLFDCLMIEIPQVNLLVKYLTLNLQRAKIDKLNDLLNNPIFAACTKKDAELLRQNTKAMQWLCTIIKIGITTSIFVWPTSYFVKRYHDQTEVVPIYVPFETKTWTRFSCSVLMEVIPVFWVGYGHLALDCVVATYYAQAEVQLKIIKYNLEHLFDSRSSVLYVASVRAFRYIDECNTDIKERFVHYVQRYEKLVWYTKKVDEVFNTSMSFQFFTSTVTICMVIYKMSTTQVLSVPFVFLIVLLTAMLFQVFLYCYYGNLVQYEGLFVNNSIYLSDWCSTSPRFRRLLAIAMVRWSRTLTPKVSGIIPLSLTTFVTIVRSSYSLYAVLRTKQG